MTIVVESGCASPSAERMLRAMFEDRKSVFVDLLKWDVPVLDGRFEIDQFDDEHATYLIIADGDGDHLGSARLLPTTRRTSSARCFRSSAPRPPPIRPRRIRDHALLPLAPPECRARAAERATGW